MVIQNQHLKLVVKDLVIIALKRMEACEMN
jgi:hypothetical protein